MAAFPGVKHLMCYFHVVKNCKEKLRSYDKNTQRDVLGNVSDLHSCVTEVQFQQLLNTFLPRWNDTVPDFSAYFTQQWVTNAPFNTWKVYCN